MTRGTVYCRDGGLVVSDSLPVAERLGLEEEEEEDDEVSSLVDGLVGLVELLVPGDVLEPLDESVPVDERVPDEELESVSSGLVELELLVEPESEDELDELVPGASAERIAPAPCSQ